MYTLEINHFNVDIKIETDDFELLHMLQETIEETYEQHLNKDDDEEEEIIITKKKK
jgi:hypothetical protein